MDHKQIESRGNDSRDPNPLPKYLSKAGNYEWSYEVVCV